MSRERELEQKEYQADAQVCHTLEGQLRTVLYDHSTYGIDKKDWREIQRREMIRRMASRAMKICGHMDYQSDKGPHTDESRELADKCFTMASAALSYTNVPKVEYTSDDIYQ